MKIIMIGVMLWLCSPMAWTAQLCIAPIDQSYQHYGQYGDYEVQVGKKTYVVSHSKAVKVTNLTANQTMNITIKKQGKAIESFPIKLGEKERICLLKNDLYPTWMLVDMRKSCQC